MTMMLRQDKKKNARKKIALFLSGAVFVYVVFFSPVSNVFSGTVHLVAVPFWKVGNTVKDTAGPFFSYFSSRRELYLENEDLKKQVISMGAKLVDRSFLREENKRLKEFLGRDAQQPRIFAVVLAKPDQTPYDTLIIDVGEKQGVSNGDRVLLENVIIGELTEVFYSSSKVQLYSSPGVKLIVSVGDVAISVEVHGRGGGNFEIEIPKNSNVSVGDTIYIPDIEPRILGVVERIDSSPKDAFERILFKSPANPSSLRFVEVIP